MTRIAIVAVAIAVVAALAGFGLRAVYQAGAESERAAVLKKAVELVKERDKIDAKFKTATPADICRRLGGKWLPDQNECS